MTDRLTQALAAATAAHTDQVRRFNGGPYIAHPIAVATIVTVNGGDENMVIAALLHDTVEDTPVTLDAIRDAFGDDVATLVEAVTKRDGESYWDFLDRTIAAGPRAVAVKRADIEHNRSTLPAGESLHKRYEKALAVLDGAQSD